MAKSLVIEYKGKTYTLEYTRRSVEKMERNGFLASDITTKPMLTLPELFAGAFLAHHTFLKRDVIDDIFAHITEKGELISKLAEMYNEPLQTLIDEPEENPEGNASWTASW